MPDRATSKGAVTGCVQVVKSLDVLHENAHGVHGGVRVLSDDAQRETVTRQVGTLATKCVRGGFSGFAEAGHTQMNSGCMVAKAGHKLSHAGCRQPHTGHARRGAGHTRRIAGHVCMVAGYERTDAG